MKELEKLGTKAGVVTQTIKDVVQSLVDDRLVEMEKIGSANFYWSFPSKAKSEVRQKMRLLEFLCPRKGLPCL